MASVPAIPLGRTSLEQPASFGGITMGLALALTEETDERRGRIANPSLAEYYVPIHLDVRRIDIMWTDIPDPHAPTGPARHR